MLSHTPYRYPVFEEWAVERAFLAGDGGRRALRGSAALCTIAKQQTQQRHKQQRSQPQSQPQSQKAAAASPPALALSVEVEGDGEVEDGGEPSIDVVCCSCGYRPPPPPTHPPVLYSNTSARARVMPNQGIVCIMQHDLMAELVTTWRYVCM